MTGPEHYSEAERWLAHAKNTYLDDSSDAGPRESYASETEWVEAMEEGAENYERKLREMAVFASLAQAHAQLAQISAAVRVGEPVCDSAEDGVAALDGEAKGLALSASPVAWARLGRELRERREAAGLSRRALSEKAGVSQKAIQVAAEGRVPSARWPQSIGRISRALGWAPEAATWIVLVEDGTPEIREDGDR